MDARWMQLWSISGQPIYVWAPNIHAVEQLDSHVCRIHLCTLHHDVEGIAAEIIEAHDKIHEEFEG